MKFILTILLALPILLTAQESPLVMSPSLSPDGKTIAFSYQGDIWTVSVNGGTALRLTIHEGYDGRPLWSPDGQTIAFSSDRYGNNDVFTIPAKGGMPTRLTYHSTSDVPTSWDGNDAILFLTRRTYGQVEREAELYRIMVKGGTPSRHSDALALDAAYSPNRQALAMVRGTCRTSREAYYGPANRDLWLYFPADDSYKQMTDYAGNDFSPEWGDNQTLYYLSSKDGKYNIYRMKLSANQKEKASTARITDESDFGIFSFDVSADGKTIVYHKANEIYVMSTQGGRATKVKIDIAADYRFDPVVKRNYNRMDEYAVSPNGKWVAFSIHGEIFVSGSEKDNSRTIRLTKSAARDRDPVWVSDQVLMYSSDVNGQYDFYAVSSSDTNELDIFNSLKHKTTRLTNSKEDERNAVMAPNGKRIAFVRGRGEFWVADIDSIGNLSKEKQLLDGWDSPGGVSWSPDSKWLAYSLSDLDFNSEIFIHDADGIKTPVNVSMHPRGDYGPVWSKDGSKLAFNSSRNNGDGDIWFVWLKEADYFKTGEEWKREEEAAKNEKKGKKDKKETEVEPIKIDFDNIHERLQQVTAFPGNESNIEISQDGKTFYYVSRRDGRRDYVVEQAMYSIKWDSKENKELVDGKMGPGALSMSKDGEQLYFLSRGTLQVLKTKDNKTEPRPVMAKMEINYPEELSQIFNEGWRALDAGFYDPKFHGQNWQKLREKYEPLCMMASTKEDFQFMFNAMLGQLNASHMGMASGENPKETQRTNTGLIGVELAQLPNGVLISKILPGSPADKKESKLYVGEIIRKVNGITMEPYTNFYALMDETAGEQVLLELTDTTGATREVLIWPVRSLRNELYEDWVRERRRLTTVYSKGRLGYIHIQGMDWSSFERFERDLMAAGYGKEGLVIDVRYNGGGWTTDYLMAVLTVRQHAYTVPRGAAQDLKKEHQKFSAYYPYGERLPLSAWTKPSIAMCNENSYSNAEIFSHAYKTLELGTLVGKPTFGAVISTGGYGLMDGSYVRMPFRGWFVKGSGMNMENGPAVPDIEIDLSPDYKAKGKDEQLQKAVELLLGEMKMKD